MRNGDMRNSGAAFFEAASIDVRLELCTQKQLVAMVNGELAAAANDDPSVGIQQP